jgi:hypothetical protein
VDRRPSLAALARRRVRYERRQLSRRSRSWILRAPSARAPGRALWICSWQRSGSTWLAEMLAGARTTRLVYEPANLHDRVFDGERAARVPLPRPGDPAVDDVVAALAGRLRGPWVDQLNHAHLERRRVVKDVRALAVAGEVRVRVPATPVVVLVRHPLAVARSAVELGWTGDADLEAGLGCEVDAWCELHAAALADPRLEDAWFVSYEALREDPRATLRGVLEYAATFDRDWLATDLAALDPTRRSATDFRAAPAGARADAGAPSATVLAHATAALAASGLDALYGPGPACLADPNELARRRRDATR